MNRYQGGNTHRDYNIAAMERRNASRYRPATKLRDISTCRVARVAIRFRPSIALVMKPGSTERCYRFYLENPYTR